MDTAETAIPAAPDSSAEGGTGGVRYWRRSLVLAVVVAVLLALSWWDERRMPDGPPTGGTTVSTPAPGLPRD